MENVSLKQWIVAGILSGIVVGILVLILLSFISSGVPLGHPIFIWDVFFSSVFLGLIIGIILFFMYNKLPGKKRLSKCLLISIVTVMLMIFFSFYFYAFYFDVWEGVSGIPWLIPFVAIGHLHLGMSHLLFEKGFLFLWVLPSLLIGAAFGFLINYFISRMERKKSK